MNETTHTRRDVLRSVGAGAAALALPQGALARSSGQGAKPNILLILVDDLGYGDLSCYGANDLETPNLDGLVASGMRFDRFYANCPVCSPTRASVLTGRYPDLVGVPGVIRTKPHQNFGHLSSEAVLLPTVLKRAGYHTAIVGKWHLGLETPNTPNERGFDHLYGFLGDMMDDYYTHRRHGINYMRRDDREIDPKGHATDLFTQWAVDYIDQRSKSKQPFFLYLAYNAPHSPIQPPKAWLDRVKRREPGLSDKRAKLVALVEHLDDGIGKVLAALKANGLSDNTLIIFTSDNGGSLPHGGTNGPLNGGKQDMLEGGIRVPMCAVWPGRIRPGSRSERVAMTMDLFPAVCQAAEAAFDHEIDGLSCLPTLLGKPQPDEKRFLFWVRLEGGRRYQRKPYYAVRQGDWKLLHLYEGDRVELYDLASDPGERRDLAAEEPELSARLDALLDRVDTGLRNDDEDDD